MDGINSYECDCIPGYVGDKCETGISGISAIIAYINFNVTIIFLLIAWDTLSLVIVLIHVYSSLF